jgi:hypothetical protein
MCGSGDSGASSHPCALCAPASMRNRGVGPLQACEISWRARARFRTAATDLAEQERKRPSALVSLAPVVKQAYRTPDFAQFDCWN